MCLTGKILVLEKPHSEATALLARSSMLMNRQGVLNKVIFKTETHKRSRSLVDRNSVRELMRIVMVQYS